MAAGRWRPIARRWSGSTRPAGPPTSRPTCGWTPRAPRWTPSRNSCARSSTCDPLMRYLVLSDIHANLEALDATLDHAAGEAYDRVLVLGDLVGYGAAPASVIDRVRDLDPLAIVRGNHDRAAARVDDAETFNLSARRAVAWTAEVLTPAHRAYLAALPEGPALVNSGIEICHGAPSGEDDYVFEAHDAARALQDSVRPICLFGHTHIQVIYQWAPDGALDVSGTARSSARRLSPQPEFK